MAGGVGPPGERVHFMMAGAGQLQAPAIYIQLTPPHIDAAEPDVPLYALQVRLPLAQLEASSIEVRLLCAPLQRRGHACGNIHRLCSAERLDLDTRQCLLR